MLGGKLSRLCRFANHASFGTSKYVTTITSKDAPKAIGPYSQAKTVKPGATYVFASGQLGMDPKTGDIVSDDVSEQTKRLMQNLEAVLIEANSSFDHVVKATVYLTDIAYFAKMNEEYTKFFKTKEYPARVTFAVKALPKGGKVEIEVMAVTKD